jgi:hypothetical protein
LSAPADRLPLVGTPATVTESVFRTGGIGQRGGEFEGNRGVLGACGGQICAPSGASVTAAKIGATGQKTSLIVTAITLPEVDSRLNAL